MASLRRTTDQKDKENILEEIIKAQLNGLSFNASKPAETVSYGNQEGEQTQEWDESKSQLKI